MASQKGFHIGQDVYLHHTDGLLPARVVGKHTSGKRVQIAVSGWAGKHWFPSGQVLTQEEHDAWVGKARKVVAQS